VSLISIHELLIDQFTGLFIPPKPFSFFTIRLLRGVAASDIIETGESVTKD